MPDLSPATLRAWREARGLSRREAAATLGLNERTLENLEYGRASASPLWGTLAVLVPLIDERAVSNRG